MLCVGLKNSLTCIYISSFSVLLSCFSCVSWLSCIPVFPVSHFYLFTTVYCLLSTVYCLILSPDFCLLTPCLRAVHLDIGYSPALRDPALRDGILDILPRLFILTPDSCLLTSPLF